MDGVVCFQSGVVDEAIIGESLHLSSENMGILVKPGTLIFFYEHNKYFAHQILIFTFSIGKVIQKSRKRFEYFNTTHVILMFNEYFIEMQKCNLRFDFVTTTTECLGYGI